MNLSLADLLPIRSAIVTLRFTEPAAPRFFHQAAISAWLREWAVESGDFDRLIRIDTPENGRVQYQAGDFYRFNLLALGGGLDLLERLFGGLKSLPLGALRTGERLPFRDNLACVAFHDAFSGEPVAATADLSAYAADTLDAEAALWAGVTDFSLEFYSPVRLLKEKSGRDRARGEARYVRELVDLPPELLLHRAHDSLADLLRRRGAVPTPRPPAPALSPSGGQVFWVQSSYTDAAGQEHPMGGLLGTVRFTAREPLPGDWLRLILLGQYTGIGQRTAFGFGRYRLLAPDGGHSLRRALPAHSLLQRLADEDNLREAYRKIRANVASGSEPEGFEEEDWPPPDTGEEDEEAFLDRARRASARLLENRYEPPPLLGFVIHDRDGGPRPLAAPPFLDRVLQRALAQVLAPGLESLHYAHSYGFRSGRSRLDARFAIQAAWREGFRWVYESDIAEFFDSVSWDRLAGRLHALYDDDPAVARILAWMAAPVRYEGELIPRVQGLPQGSPLSPLLANLLLDDFDRDLETAGFRLIRFADDFVVLCKTQEQAQEAHAAALASLAEHGLRLNPEKTRVAAMSDGFRYLGYLFLNDLAVDVSGQPGADPAAPAPIPPLSWLARAKNRPPRPLDPNRPLRRPAPPPPAPVPRAVGEIGAFGTLLCITGDSTVLSTAAGQLRISRGDAVLHELPWRQLQAVVLFGRHHLTEPALRAALAAEVPIHLASAAGTYRGVLWTGQPREPGHGLWLRQASLFSDPACTLELARAVVEARVRHQREALRRRNLPAAALDDILGHLSGAADLAALNGFEGRAARSYFEGLADLVPPEFGFTGRNRHPPEDPFNALLSLGYTVLFGYAESLLRADGLLPWLGFYHQGHGRHAVLASDLMEPFRHLVENAALTLILRRELKVSDFTAMEGGACYLREEARRRYLAHLLDRFATPVKAPGTDTAQTIPEHLHEQNLSLIRHLQGGAPFAPWRMR
jgi:group II intron reverse transcriptase/maturase/CRISPR-associated endonuclease Cas1